MSNCIHFNHCGGCTQHALTPEAYLAEKHQIAQRAITKLGAGPSLLTEMLAIGPGKRRRVEWHVSVRKGVVSIGFFAHRSHEVVDMQMCLVAHPAIMALLAPLREQIASLKKPGAVTSVHATLAGNGLDICLRTQSHVHPQDIESWKQFAATHNILRIAEKPDAEPPRILARTGDVWVTCGSTQVELPVEAFLQATLEAQTAITDIILAHTEGCAKVMDLYAGCGSYSFPLIERGHRVAAFEGNAEMVTAMQNALRREDKEAMASAQVRDLYTRPLTASELMGWDAVVINPPRNGAEPQAKQLAASDVSRVIMVSCNPQTFTRDAMHLVNAGFRLLTAPPIDQFHLTNHLELVGVFAR